jgi:hypothetical protein
MYRSFSVPLNVVSSAALRIWFFYIFCPPHISLLLFSTHLSSSAFYTVFHIFFHFSIVLHIFSSFTALRKTSCFCLFYCPPSPW